MAPNLCPAVSPFLHPGSGTKVNSLAIIQLSRDNLLPVYLQEPKGEHDGYAEGAVVNTRYGSFPHSTLLDVPWGSQIRASKVDTGSRGRKRKRPAADDDGAEQDGSQGSGTPGGAKQAVVASSGFVHVLPPTPELWTASLPHRTQVVYAPDYSYILHRIRARPGTRIIEAGAGSGSFTHASARAVYNGYPKSDDHRKGKVFSFEYHEQRYEKMKVELADHGMEGLVHLTHRDVYKGGFLVDGKSPEAEAVFLDLPAPWEALHHLSRRNPSAREAGSPKEQQQQTEGRQWVSPLNPKKSAYICTFSPCIEQVTRTVSAMRRLGWVDIEMVEIINRKIQVFREKIGLNIPTEKGANIAPANVAEAVARLTDLEDRSREHFRTTQASSDQPSTPMDVDEGGMDGKPDPVPTNEAKVVGGATRPSTPKPFAEGRLITRGEPEIKTHTSYLVFAVLPREWTEEDEAEALRRLPCGAEQKVIGGLGKEARRLENRERMEGKRKGGKRKAAGAEEASEEPVVATNH